MASNKNIQLQCNKGKRIGIEIKVRQNTKKQAALRFKIAFFLKKIPAEVIH